MYQLICEGGCNTHLRAVDDYARKYMEDKWRDRIIDIDGLMIRQRSLAYTPHDYDGHQATCAECGHKRGYGDRRTWPIGPALSEARDADADL